MARSEGVATRSYKDTRKAKDAEVVLGNGIASAMVAAAIALAVVGLLVGFDVISTNNPFDNGALWLAAGVIVGLCANVFRREHHVVEPEEYDSRNQS